MKTKRIRSVTIALALALAVQTGSAAAQNASTNTANSTGSTTRTDRSIEYHNGSVLTGTQIVYVIWYGNWSTNIYQQLILADFMSNLGSSPYFQINQGYPNSSGQAPSGDLTFGGGAADAYSHGAGLSEADVADVVANAILTGGVPLDRSGIYAVLTSPDVTVIDGATQFCLTCCNLHGHSVVAGSDFRYVFVGSPRRCPGACSPQSQSPNSTYEPGSYEADAMASWLAAALSEVVTDPHDNAWYDRYGLENAEKCEGTYGETYTVTNPAGQLAQANVKIGQRHYLLQQNWVNGKKGHCAMSLTQ
jgi:hypothetical protein